MSEFDLIVIGGGSAGVRTARWSAGLGAKVALCESQEMGGTCVLRGCVPKKMMVYGSQLPKYNKLMESYGWKGQPQEHDWKFFNQARASELKRLSGLYQNMLDKNKVETFYGKAFFAGPNEVQVGEHRLKGRHIVIATGSTPVRPEFEGAEHALVSDDLFRLPQKPESITIIGTGFIGVEFACIFNSFGVKTTLLSRSGTILRGFDEDCSQFVLKQMIESGIIYKQQSTLKKLTKEKNSLHCYSDQGEEWDSQHVLFATGRRPNTHELKLEAAQVEVEANGRVKVDQQFRTSQESIFAIGDCSNRMNLTPVATYEGTLLAEALFGSKKDQVTYENIPSAVFSQPPLSTCGLTEKEAKDKFGEVDIYESSFRPLKYTLSQGHERVYLKLVVHSQSQKVLGAHMAGEDAPEIIQGLAIAIKAGATKEDFDRTIGIHPTTAEEFVTLREKRK